MPGAAKRPSLKKGNLTLLYVFILFFRFKNFRESCEKCKTLQQDAYRVPPRGGPGGCQNGRVICNSMFFAHASSALSTAYPCDADSR